MCEKSLQDRSRIQWSLIIQIRASFIKGQSSHAVMCFGMKMLLTRCDGVFSMPLEAHL